MITAGNIRPQVRQSICPALLHLGHRRRFWDEIKSVIIIALGNHHILSELQKKLAFVP